MPVNAMDGREALVAQWLVAADAAAKALNSSYVLLLPPPLLCIDACADDVDTGGVIPASVAVREWAALLDDGVPRSLIPVIQSKSFPRNWSGVILWRVVVDMNC